MTFNFAMQAIDQIINSAAKTLYMSGGQMGCPIVFRGPNGAAARVAAQHSQDYAAWYSQRAGPEGRLAVLRRRTPRACSRPRSAIPTRSSSSRTRSSTASRRRCRRSTTCSSRSARPASSRPGKDVTIVSWSIGMTYALKAAEELAKKHIYAEVIDLRTIRPMDIETVMASVMKTGRCVTVEEGWPQSGVGARDRGARSWNAPSTISTRRCSASRARTSRCHTPPTSRSSRCRMSAMSSRRRAPSAIAEGSGECPSTS